MLTMGALPFRLTFCIAFSVLIFGPQVVYQLPPRKPKCGHELNRYS
jgi:hypothetical protein